MKCINILAFAWMVIASQSYGEENSLVDKVSQQLDSYLIEGDYVAIGRLYADKSLSMFEYKPAIFGKRPLKRFYKSYFESTKITDIERSQEGLIVLDNYFFDFGVIEFTWKNKNQKNTMNYKAKYLRVWEQTSSGKLKLYSELYGSTQYYELDALPHSHVTVVEEFANQYYPINIDSDLKSEVEYANEVLLRSVNIGDYKARLQGYTDTAIVGRIFKPWIMGKEALQPEIYSVYRPENKVYAWHRYYRILDLAGHIVTFGHFKGGIGDWETGSRFEGNSISVRERNEEGAHPVSFVISNNDRGFKTFDYK